MDRRLLALAGLAVLAACQADQNASPSDQTGMEVVSFAISDGNNGGNPDFFFLPPLGSASTGSAFNPNLNPTIRICELDGGACKAGGYDVSFTNIAVTGSQYHGNWKSPKTPAQYRISVEVFGAEMGFADVNTTKTPVAGFHSLQAGATLAIKFWLDNDCPSGSSCIDPNTGGTQLFDQDGTTTGVTIPPQPDGGDPINLNLVACDPDLTSSGLTVFGSCLTIDSDLEDELLADALVFICDVLTDPNLPGVDHHSVNLHRRNDGNITVLENAEAPLCPSTSASTATVGGLFRALAQGNLKRAAAQFAGLLAPKPLHARRIHLGAGGHTKGFSDFQFALTGDPLPINYFSSGWSYQIDGTVPADWYSSSSTQFSLVGSGGFGENHNSCSLINEGANTVWPAGNSTLYARRTFFLSAPATVRIAVAIDNDVQVFLNGADISASNGQGATPNGQGLLVHEGCPTTDSFTFVQALGAGSHVAAFRAVDRGGSSYFDAKITIVP
jgi:hypothetical protein